MRIHSLLLAVVCLLLPIAAGAGPLPSAPLTPAAAALQGFPQKWTPVGTKSAGISGVTNYTETYDQSRMWEVLTSRGPVSQIKLRYSNWNGNFSGGETSANCAVQISAGIEIEPTLAAGVTWDIADGNIVSMPVTFGGNKTAVIPINGHIDSDPFTYPFYAGQTIYVRTWRMSQCPYVSLPSNHYSDTTHHELTNDGFFTGVPFNASTTPVTNPDYVLSASYVTPPLRPGTVGVFGSGITGTILDNGSGGWAAGGGLCAGSTVNYTTGEVALCLSVATAPSNITFLGQGYYNTVMPDNTVTYNPPGFVGWNLHNAYGPSAVIGILSPQGTKSPYTWLTAGDSIDYGWGDTTNYQQSWIDMTLNGGVGSIKIAAPGETLINCAGTLNYWRRLGTVDPVADRGIFNYGTNDVGISGVNGTAAGMETNWLACATKLASLLSTGWHGLYGVTLLPKTVSSSNNTPITTAGFGPGTVASGSPSIRNAFNAWLYTQVGVTIAGVFDPSAYVESSPASQAGAGNGTWASLTYTYDGTHPSTLGHQTISTGFAGNPIFSPP